MAELFASGRIVDLILALVVIEAGVLLAWRARRGGGPSPIALVANLAAGAGLMLALRAALTGSSWIAVAAPLTLALGAHVLEMVLRFRSAD